MLPSLSPYCAVYHRTVCSVTMKMARCKSRCRAAIKHHRTDIRATRKELIPLSLTKSVRYDSRLLYTDTGDKLLEAVKTCTFES